MPTPQWVLLIAFWLHMLATVVWLGSLAAVSLWVLPSMQRSLPANQYADWLLQANQRLSAIGWFSLALLTVTGLIQMGANVNYTGLLSFANDWALAILLKHIVIFGMVGVSAYITWNVAPTLQRAALRRSAGASEHEEQILGARLQRLILINLVLGFVVLAFTALARIA